MVQHQSSALTPREALTIARIVKVNHAGEYGAIQIYSAQIGASARHFPDIVASLGAMLAHEKEHCAAFVAAMPARNARPCRMMFLWSFGGWLLGAITAAGGRQAIWICTAAVEAAVHQHLKDQLAFLASRDPDLHATILAIQQEEISHLNHAEANINVNGRGYRALRWTIATATDVLIWMSTSGDSARMKAELRRAA